MASSTVNRYLVAGPCAVESREQVYETARQLHERLAGELSLFRAGVWKPRSRAGAFSGVGEAAFPWLQQIQQEFRLPVCVEVAGASHVESCLQNGITRFWIGARTAVNPFIVQEIADAVRGQQVTVLVKNPAIPDLQLWLGNVERFEKAGVKEVWAVHRGFADSKENILRNAPLWEIPVAFKVARPDLPLLCDPSHISGKKQYIKQIAQIALDYGCDGLMLECHCQPECALSDSEQQLTPEELGELLKSLVFKQPSQNVEDLLRKQRTLIRHIDAQMAQLLARRFSVVQEIAQIKREHNIPLIQPEQWNSVVKNYQQYELKDADYQEFLQNFLNLMHQASLKCQQNTEPSND